MKNLITENLSKLNNLVSETNALYHEAAVKIGLSDSKMQILYTTCNYGGSCPLFKICQLSGLSKQTINSAVHSLENDGIVYLKEETGRTKDVYLTEKGKSMLDSTVIRIIKSENSILESWGEEETKEYLRLMQKYINSFKKELENL